MRLVIANFLRGFAMAKRSNRICGVCSLAENFSDYTAK